MLVRKRVLEKYSALRVSNRGEAERFLSSFLQVDNDFENALLDPITKRLSKPHEMLEAVLLDTVDKASSSTQSQDPEITAELSRQVS